MLQFYVQLAVCELLIHLIHGSCVNIVSFCSKHVVQVIIEFMCPIFDGLVHFTLYSSTAVLSTLLWYYHSATRQLVVCVHSVLDH